VKRAAKALALASAKSGDLAHLRTRIAELEEALSGALDRQRALRFLAWNLGHLASGTVHLTNRAKKRTLATLLRRARAT
jgi:hypothetical protein